MLQKLAPDHFLILLNDPKHCGQEILLKKSFQKALKKHIFSFESSLCHKQVTHTIFYKHQISGVCAITHIKWLIMQTPCRV